ncbi:hypothetical protein D9M68_715920 [compost metagenome]
MPTTVAKHFSALIKLHPDLVEQAMNDWYKIKNYERWAAQYPVKIDEYFVIVNQKQREWCDLAEITQTPTIFVNGYKLIEPYDIRDMRYLW